jgi:predicted nucleic-acid-binding Zn-ribbon protein
MNTKIQCPKCGSTKCTTVDNEPLSHDTKWLTENDMQFDNQLYVFFQCNNCDNKRFRGTLEIITQDEHKALVDLHNKFPNGFQSWLQTHHEVVAYITTNERDALVGSIKYFEGTNGLYDLAEQWTNEFEQTYKGKEWNKDEDANDDYWPTIERFLNQKNVLK